MIALTLPFILAWLLFYYAASVTELYLALALCGLCGGLLEAPVSTRMYDNGAYDTDYPKIQ